MKNNWLKWIVLSLSLYAPAQLWAQSASDVVVNGEVAAASLSKDALKDILLGKTTYWPGGQAVIIVVLTDKTDAALQDVTGMSASQFKTHWQRLVFSGRGQLPKQMSTEDELITKVIATKGAIALVPSGTATKEAKKVEIK